MQAQRDNEVEGVDMPPEFVIVRDVCEKENGKLDDLLPREYPLEIADLRQTGGDYTFKGGENYVAIERKSASDLLQTLWGKTQLADGTWQKNSERFAFELSKLGKMQYSYVAVEGYPCDLATRIIRRARICEKFGHKQRIDYGRTMALISSLQVEFGLSFRFFKDRKEMATTIATDLYHGWRRFHGLSKSKIGKYTPGAVNKARPIAEEEKK